MSISVQHIDTCLPCYLNDHHNRTGECLLQVSVTSKTTYAEVMDALLSEWEGADTSEQETPCGFDNAVRLLIRDEFSTVPNMAAPFDAAIEDGDEDDDDEGGESCYAYFLVKWECE